MLDEYQIFDSHLHIIDGRYPLVPNNGYVPDSFTHTDYLNRMRFYNLIGGAIVSGLFQAFDQSYLLEALKNLYAANPHSLMFGTDLPSTRASRAYADNDFMQVIEALGPEGVKKAFSENALNFYRIRND